MSVPLSFFVRKTKKGNKKMNSGDPADTTSAQNQSRGASPHFSVQVVRFGVASVLVMVAIILLVRLVLTPGLFNDKPCQGQVVVTEDSAPAVPSAVTPDEVRAIIADFLAAQQKAEKERHTDVLPQAPAPGVTTPSEAVSEPDGTAAPSRMVFIRIGDAAIEPKGDSRDYYVLAGTDNLSGPICGKAIAKGLVAVSRKPGLRAEVTMPSGRKIGIIPDWRVWGLLGSGSKVVDIAIPTDGEYVQFDQWAKAKEVRFYWTSDAVDANKDPLVIKVFKGKE